MCAQIHSSVAISPRYDTFSTSRNEFGFRKSVIPKFSRHFLKCLKCSYEIYLQETHIFILLSRVYITETYVCSHPRIPNQSSFYVQRASNLYFLVYIKQIIFTILNKDEFGTCHPRYWQNIKKHWRRTFFCRNWKLKIDQVYKQSLRKKYFYFLLVYLL